MSSRLERAIRRLSPVAVEEVADFAEYLAERQSAASVKPRHLRLDWIGAASGLRNDYASGVEAAHTAKDLMAQSALGKPKP